MQLHIQVGVGTVGARLGVVSNPTGAAKLYPIHIRPALASEVAALLAAIGADRFGLGAAIILFKGICTWAALLLWVKIVALIALGNPIFPRRIDPDVDGGIGISEKVAGACISEFATGCQSQAIETLRSCDGRLGWWRLSRINVEIEAEAGCRGCVALVFNFDANISRSARTRIGRVQRNRRDDQIRQRCALCGNGGLGDGCPPLPGDQQAADG